MIFKLNKISLTLAFFALTTNAMAFDLEDYATTYRASRDELVKAEFELAAKKQTYIDAFKARMTMEKDFRNTQIAQAAPDPINDDADTAAAKVAAKALAEEELKKLDDLQKASVGCGLKND